MVRNVKCYERVPSACGEARRWAATVLGRHDVELPVRADVALVLSELVANAVVHGADPLQVHLLVNDAYVLVAVSDGGDAEVRRAGSSTASPLEGGLRVIDGLARHWGVGRLHHGKIVWVEVARSSRSSAERSVDRAAALLAGERVALGFAP